MSDAVKEGSTMEDKTKKVTLTDQQRAAVSNRGGNLLVSAAAGTGKTKVLIERIMDQVCGAAQKNISDFLVITYTKAAAAELRGKIVAELSKRLAANPDDSHLRNQMHLMYGAKISTVHAFCADVLRAHAAEAGISADFRVGEEQETRVLRSAAMEELLESVYKSIETKPNIKAFVDELGMGRDDSAVAAILFRVYDTIQSHPWPEKWTARCIAEMDIAETTDAADTPWGEYIIQNVKATLSSQLPLIEEAITVCRSNEKLAECYLPTIAEDRALVEDILRAKTWDQMTFIKATTQWERLKTIRKGMEVPERDKERVQELRKLYKKVVDAKMGVMYGMSDEVLSDLRLTTASVNGMFELVAELANRYTAKKELHNLLDFSDLEHLCIRLLVDTETGEKTEIAKTISNSYTEIMVDEYQDTNGVQETIFNAISTGSNLFMVGDVKQSIYRFRLAEPEVFLHHYLTYADADMAGEGEPRKIRLTKNFRSRPEILNAANAVMTTCMSPDVGGVSYTEHEALSPGLDEFPEPDGDVVELSLIDMDVIAGNSDDDEVIASIAKADIEAEYVADRIRDMLDYSTIADEETGAPRPITLNDIAILMYAPRNPAAHYVRALTEKGIAVKAAKSGSIMETTEISTLFCFMQVIDNPTQDIPLVSVLASPLFGFTADDLARVKMAKKDAKNFYEALIAASETDKRAKAFLGSLATLREMAPRTRLSRLFSKIIDTTDAEDVFGAMGNGDQRVANIRKFGEMIAAYEAGGARGLFSFICHLEALMEQGAELPQATCSTAAQAVTIMSVHASKGLEFPIVFLVDLSRKFNMNDLKDTALLDKDLGAGVQVVVRKPELPVHRYPTIARSAIAAKAAAEAKSEALRVLYVAMTRAKQRLIMTYCDKLGAQIGKMQEHAAAPLSSYVAQSVTNPGQWVLYTALADGLRSTRLWRVNNINYLKPGAKTMTMAEIDEAKEVLLSGIDEEFEVPFDDTKTPYPPLDTDAIMASMQYEYANTAASTTASKTVATAMVKTEMPIVVSRPKFVKEDRTTKSAEQGTATHTFLQYADFKKCREDGKVGIQNEIVRLTGNRFLNETSKDLVMVDALDRMFKLNIGRELAETPGLVREYEFTVLLPANEVFNDTTAKDDVVVQGAIDLHYVDEAGIHVIDFKTDFVKDDDEMAAKAEQYRPQIDVYEKALTKIYGVPVVERSIVFVRTGKKVPA